MKKDSFIFLDVDGPINPDSNKVAQYELGKSISSYHIELNEDKIRLLKYIIDNTGAKIVLSSKWRLTNATTGSRVGVKSPARTNLDEQLLKHGMYIYDETPVIVGDRGSEIEVWLTEYAKYNGYTPQYVVLDDNIDTIVEKHRGHVVRCSSYHGMGKKEANIAVSILNKASA